MPFTLAHPAAVFPLMRRPLIGLALICGAMAPDIPYYIRSTPLEVTAQSWYEPFTNATTSHSVSGLFPVTLPLALVAYLMLLAATPPLMWLAQGRGDPGVGWSEGMATSPTGGVIRSSVAVWAWVPISLLVGALTHLMWDSLTSSDGFLAERNEGMNETVLAGLTWVDLLQHASTVIGLALVGAALWRRRIGLLGGGAATRRRAGWVFVGLVSLGLVVGTVSVLATVDSSASPTTRDLVEDVLATAAMAGGAAVGIAIAVGTACWWLSPLRTTRGRAVAAR